MSISRHHLLALLGIGFLSSPLWSLGNVLKHDPIFPPGLDFVRSLDLDTFVERTNRKGLGAQSGRLRLRLRDPDVDAFVGLVIGVHHFNQDLRLGNPDGPSTAGVMANWGGAFGIVRGKHLWEVDVMGASLSDRLGFGLAAVGEHHLARSVLFYHRTELNIFTGDVIMDADQGLYWMWSPRIGASAGYRWFTSQHMDHSGPHIGLRFYFESPKIPFIFPSLG